MFSSKKIDDIFRNMDAVFNTHPFFTGEVYYESVRNSIQKDSDKTVYFYKGKVSRLDGPAIVYVDKKKAGEWWLDGRKTTEEVVKKYAKEKADNRSYSVFVEGQEYTIKGSKLEELKKLLTVV